MASLLDKEGNEIKYEGFPFISNIDRYVQNELANRSLQRVRPIVPYVKVTPGFSPDGTEASKIVLKGIEAPNNRDPSTYQFKELYRPDSFFRPLAGVKSITAEYKNAFGSIKKVTINWICHTLEDLERLSPYFLNPGQSMFVEWGWDNYAKNVINNNPKVNLADYLNYVRTRKKSSNGNYDGMLGIVVNYSFALNRDGGFDCSTEVVSSGYVMEGITLTNQFTQDASGNNPKVKTASQIEKERKEKEANAEKEKQQKNEVLTTLKFFMEHNFYKQLQYHYNDPQNRFNTITNDHDYFILSERGAKNNITTLVNADTGKVIKEKRISNPQDLILKTYDSSSIAAPIQYEEIEMPLRASVYASWGYLEDFVLNPYLAIKSDNTEKVLFNFDSRGSKISSHEYLRTTDLGVCIIPISNDVSKSPPVPDFKAGQTADKNLDFGYVRRLLINVQYFREVMLNATTVIDAVLQVFSGINDACINYWQFRLSPIEESFNDISKYITNTYTTQQELDASIISVHIQKEKESKTFDVMNTYKNSTNLNSSLVENRKDAIVSQRIVDINYSNRLFEEKELNKDLYAFKTKTFSIKDKETGEKIDNVTSVIRNLTFQSKLSSQAALNVFYSAQNKDGRVMGSPSTNTFQSLYDFSLNGINYSNAGDTFSAGPFEVDSDTNSDGTNPPKDANTDPGTEIELFIYAQHAYGDNLLRFLPWGPTKTGNGGKGYYVKLKDGTTLTGAEGMKMAVLLSTDGKTAPATSEALVPLECEIELEGISGIRIGDIFTIDHIPKIYQKHGTFQVIGITDTVDKNSWVTKLKAGFRVFRNIDYATVKNTPQEFTPNINNSTINSIRKPTSNPPEELIITMRKYGITDALEKAHFLSQCAHESGGFRWTQEFADGSAYEGRKDLGNTQSGDGKRFKGRGYIQITGRANYTAYNNYLKSNGSGDDILANPSLVESKYAADSACYWWKNIGRVTPYAKQGSTPFHVQVVTKRVNGGTNGYPDRLARFNGYWAKLKDDNTLYA